jgi:hypothetical protein
MVPVLADRSSAVDAARTWRFRMRCTGR